VTRTASAKLGAYAGLAALGLIAALALSRPELVALAAPFLLVPALGLLLAHEPSVDVAVTPSRERVLEEETVAVTVTVRAFTPIERTELFLPLPEGLALAEGRNPAAFTLPAGGARKLRLSVRCERWGAYVLGEVFLRTRDRLGLFRYEVELDRKTVLKVYPRPEALRALLRPRETQVYAGNQVARTKGEGIEFADIRPFLAGDRIRRVNWRASARRKELWVNEYHAERNTDVILFLDSFTEARYGGSSTLGMAVRAAAALADRYLRHKDRVGLVSFGGILNWLLPATGLAQLYRIVDALLSTEIILNYAWKDLDVIPRRTLPPKALVVALTPLLDERATHALLDLRGRGFDLTIIEVSPVPFTEQGPGEEGALAHRIWMLKREALRARYEAAGVPVSAWEEGVPLAGVLEGVRAFRREARGLRV
jgi:uncharacterized protein (DUF58 family)